MQPEKQAPRRGWFHKKDILIVGALVVAALALLWVWRGGPGGGLAVATIGVGGSQTTLEIPLDTEQVVEIPAKLPVRLQVQDGAVRFIDSVCPDHDCEGFGWLRREGDWAACLPAEVTVRVERE